LFVFAALQPSALELQNKCHHHHHHNIITITSSPSHHHHHVTIVAAASHALAVPVTDAATGRERPFLPPNHC
jgi:hypothetical protein